MLEAYADKNMIEEHMTQTLNIDTSLNFKEITSKLISDLKRMNPFGPENQKPVLCSFNVKDFGTSKLVGRELEHIKLEMIDDSSEQIMQGIAFGMSRFNDCIKSMKPFDICYTLDENTYNGNTTIQLTIKDIGISRNA